MGFGWPDKAKGMPFELYLAFGSWNPLDIGTAGYISGVSNEELWAGGTARSVNAYSTGKYYIEAELGGTTTYWASIGFGTSSAGLTTFVGNDTESWGFYVWAPTPGGPTDFYKRTNSSNTLLANVVGVDSRDTRFQLAIDADAGKIWFGYDDVWFGSPSAGSGEAFSDSKIAAEDIYIMGYAQAARGEPLILYANPTDHLYSAPAGFTAGWESGATATSGSALYDRDSAFNFGSNTIQLVYNENLHSNNNRVGESVITYVQTEYPTNPEYGDIWIKPTISYDYWNPNDKSGNIILSNNNLDARNAISSWRSVRGVTSHNSGKRYVECTFTTTTSVWCGIATSAANLSSYLGSDINGWGIYAYDDTEAHTSKVYGHHSGDYLDEIYDGPFTVIMIAIDLDDGKIWGGADGTWFQGGNPATGTNPLWTDADISSNNIYLMTSALSVIATTRLRSDPADMTYSAPAGFTAGWGYNPDSNITRIYRLPPIGWDTLGLPSTAGYESWTQVTGQDYITTTNYFDNMWTEDASASDYSIPSDTNNYTNTYWTTGSIGGDKVIYPNAL